MLIKTACVFLFLVLAIGTFATGVMLGMAQTQSIVWTEFHTNYTLIFIFAFFARYAVSYTIDWIDRSHTDSRKPEIDSFDDEHKRLCD